MAFTLNQILSRLKSLALSHQQINDFRDGDLHEFDVNGDLNYAICLVEQLSGSINRATREQVYNFRIYFLDRVGVSEDTEGNEREVISDMSSIAADFVAMLNYPGYQYDWVIGDSVTETPVTEGLGDMVAGVYIEISIAVEFLVDRCKAPTTTEFI